MLADKGAVASALDFHRTTYADAAMLSDWAMLSVDDWPDEWFVYNEKCFPRLERIQLQEPEAAPAGLGHQWLAGRRSSRAALEETSLTELSNVLWYTTHSEPTEDRAPGSWHRPYPSAGGRLGCEFYVIAQNVTGLPSGVYSYGVAGHELTRLRSRVTEPMLRFIFGDGWVARTSAVIAVTLSTDRLETKYGGRGYRYGLIETGAATQTLCLVAGALSIGTCVLGGFADIPLGQLLFCTPNSEVPVVTIAISQNLPITARP
ncbi:SagB family peptide dehydrogenase [Streptomyces sp. AC550_RSS872]|uniref:SagB family peptide dehydrogenase n=1 Tax=Streptomyces sp. AC550_RSS872 TaxID=2823689 RepID=UPI001C251535|nr:SagB family peptide dehydrogenase [Streptomyces sp. AC550_RSS872]